MKWIRNGFSKGYIGALNYQGMNLFQTCSARILVWRGNRHQTWVFSSWNQRGAFTVSWASRLLNWCSWGWTCAFNHVWLSIWGLGKELASKPSGKKARRTEVTMWLCDLSHLLFDFAEFFFKFTNPGLHSFQVHL